MRDSALPARILSSVSATRTDTPRVLLYTPVVRGNPIQEMIYKRLWDHGIAALGVHDHRELRHAALAVDAGGDAVIHLHWTSSILPIGGSESELRLAAQDFLKAMRRLKDIGVKLIWTIHNRLPHDCSFPTVHIEFREELSALADVIHVMSEHAVAELEMLYPIPHDKVAVVPLPSYVGVYPDFAAQADCRVRLGLHADDLVIAAPGAIRPYKQLDRLHRAIQAASARTPERLRLVVAGAPSSGGVDDIGPTLAALRGDPWVTLIPHAIADRDMSEVVIASDVVSCAYDSPLVSAVSVLAISLSRPVIAPNRATSRWVLGDSALYVDLDAPGGLIDCLSALRRPDLLKMRTPARARADEFTVDRVSDEFAAVVARLL